MLNKIKTEKLKPFNNWWGKREDVSRLSFIKITPVGGRDMELEEPNDNNREIENVEEVRDDNGETEFPKRIPPWKKQITFRGVIASFVIGGIYSLIIMKLNLTTGLTPNLNVSAALLAFIFMRTWTKLLDKVGIVTVPFNRQENTMIQTCVVACYGIAVGGGFGSYLLGLNKKTYDLTGGAGTIGNSPGSYKELSLGWMLGFLFITCFIGLFVLIPLRKIKVWRLEV